MPSFDLVAVLKARDQMSGTLHAASNQVRGLGDTFSRLGTTAQVTAGVFGAAIGFNLVSSLRSSIDAAGESAAGFENWKQRISAMLKASGADFKAELPKIESDLEGFASGSVFSLNDVRDAFGSILSIVLAAGGEPKDALEILGNSMDTAAAQGKGLDGVARDMAKAWTGDIGPLKTYGATVTESVEKPYGSLTEALTAYIAKTGSSMLASDDMVATLTALGINVKKAAGTDGILSMEEGLRAVEEAYRSGNITQEEYRGILESLGVPMSEVTESTKSGRDAVQELGEKYQGAADISDSTSARMAQNSLEQQKRLETYGGVVNGFKIIFTDMTLAGLDGIVALGKGVIDTLDLIGASFDWLGESVTKIVVGLGEITYNAFVKVLDSIKGGINAAISLVNGAINGLNSISVSIPDWVPIFGGSTFGLNIATIPMLANGGIITGPTLAMLGERGPEAVIPLDRGSSTGTTINVYVENVYGYDDFRSKVNNAISGDVRTRVVF